MEEMEECLEIVFISEGNVSIGFEINRQRYFAVKLKDGVVVGGFNVTFHQKSNYCWRCDTEAKGFFIYKHDWLKLIEDSSDLERITKHLK